MLRELKIENLAIIDELDIEQPTRICKKLPPRQPRAIGRLFSLFQQRHREVVRDSSGSPQGRRRWPCIPPIQ